MVTYRIRYEAENHYNHEVHEALFEFLVLPCPDDTQEVIDEKIENSLQVPVFRTTNVFGYHAVSVRVAQPFKHFRIKVACTVKKAKKGLIRSSRESLPLEEEQHILRSDDFIVDHYLYIQQTSLTELPADKIPPSLLYQQDQLLFDYAVALNKTLHNMMEYQAGVTNPSTRACDVLENPRGVCQDYSHLMLGILRYQQIPCRYVSGYLNQGQQFMGSAQMHAWIEIFIPKLGWVGFDPTNNLMADHHHIKVADGTDYNDCSPLKGYINPPVPNSTDHIVHVVEHETDQ